MKSKVLDLSHPSLLQLWSIADTPGGNPENCSISVGALEISRRLKELTFIPSCLTPPFPGSKPNTHQS
ncbi:unnamed protein product [Caretta caretta]